MLDKKFAFPYPSLQHGEQSVERFFFYFLSTAKALLANFPSIPSEKRKEANQTMEITKARWKHFLCVAKKNCSKHFKADAWSAFKALYYVFELNESTALKASLPPT